MEIPNGITRIYDTTFAWCKNLKQINIPENVTSIEKDAFNGCLSITNIHIPLKVSTIGDYAFSECFSLKEIRCDATAPPICGENALYDISRDNSTLYVPKESIDIYKSTSPWSEFANIAALEESSINDVIHDGEKTVFSNGNQIDIYGTTSGEIINVYNIEGSLVKSIKADYDNTTITGLQSDSVYILKIGGTKIKVAM